MFDNYSAASSFTSILIETICLTLQQVLRSAKQAGHEFFNGHSKFQIKHNLGIFILFTANESLESSRGFSMQHIDEHFIKNVKL